MRNKTALTQNLFPATWIHTDPQTPQSPQYMAFCQGIQALQFAWADLFELALSARSSGAAKARAQPLRWAAARTTPAHYTTNISTSLNISRHLSTFSRGSEVWCALHGATLWRGLGLCAKRQRRIPALRRHFAPLPSLCLCQHVGEGLRTPGSSHLSHKVRKRDKK